jgi:epoxyqueuosine reductase
MSAPKSRSVLLIVGGGIAAYKALELVRLLRKAGLGVRPILTEGGAQFVTPLSLSVLAGTKTRQALFNQADEAEIDHCGTCRNCLDACPTNAFPAPYKLDARRCISYLTIEHKGPIPHEFRRAMGNRIYGCDDCLAVCPWNKFAEAAAANRAFAARAELAMPRLADLLVLDDAAFRRVFSGSPIKRIGRDRMVRNAAIAAGNSEDQALAAPLGLLVHDADETVREAASWALGQLSAST